ncbi:MAG: hypothetical protein DVB31_05340 [Verrucomicrobia bacterium]|nr:MAG: hypothetical protein DVB31_05340 [Verrucomicrobiota bacterium]
MPADGVEHHRLLEEPLVEESILLDVDAHRIVPEHLDFSRAHPGRLGFHVKPDGAGVLGGILLGLVFLPRFGGFGGIG